MDRPSREEPSKSERKRQHRALQALGETLSRLPPAELARLPLDDPLRDAVVEASRLQRSALRRQLRYVGRLLSERDNAALLEALDVLQGRSERATALHHRVERWRERLLDEGDAALAELLERHPGAPRSELRHLARAAIKEREAGRPPRAARALFRLLRALEEEEMAAAEPPESGDPD